MIFGFVLSIGAVLLTFVILQFALRFIYSYDIKNGAIRIVLFSVIPVARIPISGVVQVACASPRSLWLNPWYALRLGNRLFGAAILIKRRRGLIRSIVITPDDPDRFIEQCNSAPRNP
jgi:hypothetical protein